MTRETADEFWGAEAVELALADTAPDPVTQDLARDIVERVKTLPPGAFRAWALAQPWPKFCAIVRIVSGEARREELDDDDR